MRPIILATLVLFIASAAVAQPKPNLIDFGNRWEITAYNDASWNHTQTTMHELCFFATGVDGTQVIGVWYATTHPNWRGRWAQEGDRVLMHGEFGDRHGHDATVIELFAGDAPVAEGAGQWTLWKEATPIDNTVLFANTRIRRVGFCSPPPNITDPTKVSAEVLEKAVAEAAAKVPPRLRADGKPAQSPAEPYQAPPNNK